MKQKTALITGANKGLGFQVAKELSQRGFKVFVGARNPKAGREAAEALGSNASFLEIDVADASSIKSAAQALLARTDYLDVLINNAGILLDWHQSVLETELETLEKTFRTNTAGSLLVAQAFLPLLRKSEFGRIINVSSGGGALSEMRDWAPSYSISKTALNAVTCLLAAALKDEKIAVNSVCPGWVRTDMGGSQATRSLEEGAAGLVWLATEAPSTLSGKFLRDGKEIPW